MEHTSRIRVFFFHLSCYGLPEVVVIKDLPMPVVGEGDVIVEAYRLVDPGHKRGSVVITVGAPA